MDAETPTDVGTQDRRDWHHDFDLTDPSFGDRFDQIADDLVQNCPAARTVDGEWVISRHADVSRILLDSDTFSTGQGIRGANRHPAVIEEPDRVDIDRHPNKHLTFATGRHRCLGPNFARMNIRVALEAFWSGSRTSACVLSSSRISRPA